MLRLVTVPAVSVRPYVLITRMPSAARKYSSVSVLVGSMSVVIVSKKMRDSIPMDTEKSD